MFLPAASGLDALRLGLLLDDLFVLFENDCGLLAQVHFANAGRDIDDHAWRKHLCALEQGSGNADFHGEPRKF
jgi:hypothetical protein